MESAAVVGAMVGIVVKGAVVGVAVVGVVVGASVKGAVVGVADVKGAAVGWWMLLERE